MLHNLLIPCSHPTPQRLRCAGDTSACLAPEVHKKHTEKLPMGKGRSRPFGEAPELTDFADVKMLFEIFPLLAAVVAHA